MLRKLSLRTFSKLAPRASLALSMTARRFYSEEAKPGENGEKAASTEKPAEEKKPDETVMKLEKRIADLEKEAKESKKDLLYAMAEMDTVRRVSREDVEKARLFGIQAFGKDMLEVADTLERAVKSFEQLPPEQFGGNKIVEGIFTGVKLSSNVLATQLAKHGVEKMAVKAGDEFDPNKHDALFSAPATDAIAAGRILEIVKGGYTLKDRVLRAAQVGVAQ